ncbi:MAG TPA: serpin family protein [Propionibacteriaceae bacterium]
MKDVDRRTVLQLLGLSAVALQLSGCASGDANLAISNVGRAPAGAPVRSTLSTFAAGLLDRMPDGNVVVSPASIAIVLAMLGNGTSTTTRTQFEKVLGSPIDALNVELNSLGQRLVALDGKKGTSITFSNALWLQKGTTWQQPFLDSLKKWYGAGARLADFMHDPPGAVTAINSWCSSATKGLIPTIVDTSMITTFTRVVAGNAVYIKGSWVTDFKKEATTKEPFRTGSGAEVSADTMHASRMMKYLETGSRTSIALPFRHEDLAFIVALPMSTGRVSLSNLGDLCDVLDADEALVDLALPKFHAEFAQSLKSALTGLGLVDAWTEAADFSGITGDRSLLLDFVQHKAVVTVDEKGAEAAAVTAGGAAATSLPMSRDFHADRPFLWAIVHVPTKALVMLGREDDPTA